MAYPAHAAGAARTVSYASDITFVEPERRSSVSSAVEFGSLQRRETDELTLYSSLSQVEVLLSKVPATPVPKLQLVALCLARIADPITYTQIFPYVNEMLQELSIVNSPAQVGFYSGLVESVFAISQLLTIFPCSRLSDSIGRRPVVIVGVIGTALATLAFGLSRTFLMILITRCLAGALAGNVATIQAVLAEITDASNHSIALPIYGLCWPIGSVLGPLIGGSLSNPAKHFALLKDSPFFTIYPYFLPCLTSGIIALAGALMAYIYLDETLPNKRHQPIDEGPSFDCIDTPRAYGTVTHSDAFHFEPELSTAEIHSSLLGNNTKSNTSMSSLLAIPVVRSLTVSSLALSFLAGAFDVVFVLFCYSPVDMGGLGFSATKIGYALAIAGLTAGLFQGLVLPTVLRRISPIMTYKLCMKIWPVAYIALPLLNVLARAGLHDDTPNGDGVLKLSHTALVWIGIGACLAVTRIANLNFSVVMILIKDTSPSPSALGAANGLNQLAMCAARTMAPAIVSALFAASVNNHLLGSYLWVCVMVVFAWAGIWVTDRIEFSNDERTSSEVI